MKGELNTTINFCATFYEHTNIATVWKSQMGLLTHSSHKMKFVFPVLGLLMVGTLSAYLSPLQPLSNGSIDEPATNNQVSNAVDGIRTEIVEQPKHAEHMDENRVTCWHTCFRQFRKRRPPPVREWVLQDSETTAEEILATDEQDGNESQEYNAMEMKTQSELQEPAGEDFDNANQMNQNGIIVRFKHNEEQF